MKNILILVSKDDSKFASGLPGYLLELLMAEWVRNGIDVQVARGVDRAWPTDTLIPHLDLTVIPEDYMAFMRKYPSVINRLVRDTSKSRISTNLLKRDDDYTGAVIVKTDRNYGGLPEANLRANSSLGQPSVASAIHKIAVRTCRKLAGSSPWRYVECMSPGEYPIFPSLDQVPSGVFKNRNLVVEKYIPEMDGDDYLLRYYYFLGDRETCLLLRSRERVIKFSNAFKIEEIAIHPDLPRIRDRLGFDYGKFDYFVHDGKAVVFDVNKTPGHTAGHVGGKYEQLYSHMVSHLAEGIEAIRDGSPVATATVPNEPGV